MRKSYDLFSNITYDRTNTQSQIIKFEIHLQNITLFHMSVILNLILFLFCEKKGQAFLLTTQLETWVY